MCGRFAITLPSDAMARLFAATPANDLPDVPNYNVCPTQRVHAVVSDGDRRLQSMRWGFVPHWAGTVNDGPPLINARAETIARKPAFRKSARDRRCLIPADGFYEWTKGEDDARLPWWIARADGAAMVFAGIWRDWAGADGTIRSCAIVTCAAEGDMARLHHRSPVILEERDWPLWLGEDGKGAARLMTPFDGLVWHRVGTDVNSSRASGPELRTAL